MLRVGSFTMPLYIIMQVAGGFVFGFVLWRRKEKLNLKDGNIFDFIILFIFFCLVAGRVFYIIENIRIFKKISWSIYPYYFIPGAERVWLKQLPWFLFKFWDYGMDYGALLIGGLLYSLYFYIKRIRKKMTNVFIEGICFAHIIQIIGFFIEKVYIGRITNLPIGFIYTDDQRYRIPIHFIEISVLILCVILIRYLVKIKKQDISLGSYLFIFGWMGIISEYWKDKAEYTIGKVNTLQVVYLIFVFVGILIAVYYLQLNSTKDIKSNSVQKEFFQESKVNLHRSTKKIFSYRDFESSYTNYSKNKPSIFAFLKRKLTSRKKS
jgi:prolipoprotein diacylglyceryltransferase